MGDSIDKLVALAGTVRVSGYTRQTSTGKTVRVSAYTRSPGDMTNIDIASEVRDLAGLNPDYDPTEDDLTDEQARTRMTMLQREIAARKRMKMWNPTSPAKPYDVDSTPSGDGGNIETRVPTEAARRDADRLAEIDREDLKQDALNSKNRVNPNDVKQDQLSSIGKKAPTITFPTTKAALDHLADELKEMGGPASRWAEPSELARFRRDYPNLNGLTDVGITRALNERGVKVPEPGFPKGPKPRRLNPDGDILAQYKSGDGMWNSNGTDDFGKEAASLMSDAELSEAIKFKANEPGGMNNPELLILQKENTKRAEKREAMRREFTRKPEVGQITADAFDKIINQRLREQDGGFTPAGVEFTAEDGTKVRVRHRRANLNETWGALEGGISVKRGGKEKHFSYSETPYGSKNGHRTYEAARKAALDFANGKNEDEAALSATESDVSHADTVEAYVALSREF